MFSLTYFVGYFVVCLREDGTTRFELCAVVTGRPVIGSGPSDCLLGPAKTSPFRSVFLLLLFRIQCFPHVTLRVSLSFFIFGTGQVRSASGLPDMCSALHAALTVLNYTNGRVTSRHLKKGHF